MTKIFEIKDRVFKFCAAYETYLRYAYKFLAAFALFSVINVMVGINEKIGSLPVALLLALVCCLLPQNVTLLVAAILTLLHLQALSIEVVLVAFVIFAVIFLIYFRFAPQDGMLFILTPVAFQLGIPYVLPIGTGLLKKVQSMASVICGTVLFYFIDGIRQNITVLGSTMTGEAAGATNKISVTINQLAGNKEMFLVIGVFVLASIVVYVIRRQSIDNAWKIAMVSGVLVQVSGLFAGYLLFSLSEKALGMIIGNVVALLLAFLLEFLFMDLDYSRTERVQFEDDDYYYFVKAVPKKMVTYSEKKIKRFSKTPARDARKERKLIVEELDLDDDFLD